MGSTATVAVLFCDWVASTERLTRLGDSATDGLRRRLFGMLNSCVADTGGTVVKHTGDGCMAVFERSTIGAVECARLMHERAAEVEPEEPIHLRVGLSAGEVAHDDDGDWYGTPVVEAARLCDAAKTDQTLAPALVVALVGSRGEHHSFRSVGTRALKGFPHPIEVVDVDGPDFADVEGAAGAAAFGGLPAGVPSGEDPAVSPGVGAAEPGADKVAPEGDGVGHDESHSRRNRWLAVSSVALVLAVVAGVAILQRDGERSVRSSAVPAGTTDGVAAPSGYTPTYSEQDCANGFDDALPSEAICGLLTVPESRDDPEGTQIDIPVVRIPHPDPSHGPVVLMDINEPVERTSLREAADVISIGIRGLDTGGERCKEMAGVWASALAAPMNDEEALETKEATATECVDEMESRDVDLGAYNLNEVALDLRDLFVALDLDGASIATGGYGTPAAVSFVRTNPGAVRSMIVTNPIPPGESIQAAPAANLSLQLDQLAALCESDEGCSKEYPDLRAGYEEAWSQFESAPTAVTTDALNGEGPFTVLLDGRRLTAAVDSALQSSQQVSLLPSALLGASNELVAAVSISEDVATYISEDNPNMMLLAILCSYDAEPNRLAEVTDTARPTFAGANDPAFGKACRSLGVPSVFADLQDPLDVDIPLLVAEGGLSAAGVNGWGESMASMLPRATVVSLPTMSTDLAFMPPPCLRSLRNAFLDDPENGVSAEAVAECEAESPPVEFVAPS